jgi:hypothetical protein
MLVEISAAGYTSGWLFPGAQRFKAWAYTRPWLDQGGLCVVRTIDRTYDDDLFSAIAYATRGIHGDRGMLDVRRVECGGEFQTPLQAILAALEINPEFSAFQARDSLRMALSDRACLFVITEVAAVADSYWESFVGLIEHYGKLSPAVRLCAVILDHRSAVLSEPSFDFSAGIASHRVLVEAAGTGESTLWHAYLHHRCCWEAGGSPSYAERLGNCLLTLDRNNDDGMEAILGQEASNRAAVQFDLDEIAQLIQTKVVQSSFQCNKQKAHNRLLELKAIWSPPSGNRLELLPWLSRALLLNIKLSDQLVWTLRQNLVCMPLATEVIAHCLRAEAQIRMQLHGRENPEGIPSHASDAFQRFIDGKDDYILYPSGYPLPPNRPQDIWAFAPLGEMLIACPRGAVPDLFWQTLKLRNALSHGHYVTWKHVAMARHQLQRFDC